MIERILTPLLPWDSHHTCSFLAGFYEAHTCSFHKFLLLRIYINVFNPPTRSIIFNSLQTRYYVKNRCQGYKENTKVLTRAQVRTIVQFLEEP